MSKAHSSNPESVAQRERIHTIMRLLSTIAIEEMALAHIVNAEAEKIQYVAGTLHPAIETLEVISVHDLFVIQDSVRKMMEDVLLREVMLHMKFSNMLGALETNSIHTQSI